MEYSVKLARLSDKVVFPDRLRGRVNYDAAKGLLSYQGFMTKCTYDELVTLDDDADFHRAVEALFVLTSQEVAPASSSRRLSAAIALVTMATALVIAVIIWMTTRQSQGTPGNSVTAATVSTAS